VDRSEHYPHAVLKIGGFHGGDYEEFCLMGYDVVPSALIHSTLMMEAIRSSEISVLTRTTRHHISVDDILHWSQLLIKYTSVKGSEIIEFVHYLWNFIGTWSYPLCLNV
jgi:hypothetical protein